ncbi:hypothetical protein, partial [Neptunitalea chrysea]|uniref:hypothetical protein n=1 Tax=Neptunitalea chrysea TaxID=1647581 RepID=UPI00248FB241
PEWVNGSVMNYWIKHPTHGATGLIRDAFLWMSTIAPLNIAMTWGALCIELLLCLIVFVDRIRLRALALYSGFFLHLGIIVLHGLWSFSFIMIGLLLFYVPRVQVELDNNNYKL